MTEIYKDIKDLEGLYQVSNFGRVKSLGNEKSYNSKPRLLKPGKVRGGYLQIVLSKNKETKRCYVHRLVAEAFLPNPDNLPEVNHKDEDKTNNNVENLEWCTHEYNINYGTRTEKTSKPVLQFSKNGEFIKEWESIMECERNGFDRSSVCRCCNGKRKSHKGYKWCYA